MGTLGNSNNPHTSSSVTIRSNHQPPVGSFRRRDAPTSVRAPPSTITNTTSALQESTRDVHRMSGERRTDRVDSQNHHSRGSTAVRHCRFLPSVGWCLQLESSGGPTNGPDGAGTEFHLLFLDGSRLIIESPSSTQHATSTENRPSVCYVRYFPQSHDRPTTSSDSEERYPIDKRLPMHVKRKLAHFPKFVPLF